MPVKIIGSDDGMAIFTTWVGQLKRNTRPTFSKSRSMDATPMAVLISVGHRQHSVTVIAEVINDFSNIGSLVTYTALTTMVTMGSQASGETGLNT